LNLYHIEFFYKEKLARSEFFEFFYKEKLDGSEFFEFFYKEKLDGLFKVLVGKPGSAQQEPSMPDISLERGEAVQRHDERLA
jgi:hypothetical protein